MIPQLREACAIIQAITLSLDAEQLCLMTFQPRHTGLYISAQQVDNARQQRDKRATLQMAWQWLLAEPGTILREEKVEADEPVQVRKPQLQGLAAAMERAWRYRFAEDATAGQQVTQLLLDGAGLRDHDSLLSTLMQVVATAQLAKLVSDHAAFSSQRGAWTEQFRAFARDLLAAETTDMLERCWQMALSVAAGIVLEDEALFQTGATVFREMIDNEVRPDGFIRFATEAEDGRNFERHVLATAALTLTAEAATQAGVDLWRYESREVGLNTAVTYLVYYYFYPEKWRWDEGLTRDNTADLFRQYGAWIEIATSRANPRGVELLLEEQRPFFGPLVGGLTTLSHSETVKRRRFGWLGR